MAITQPPVNAVLTLAEVHDYLGAAAVRRRIRQGIWQAPLPGIVVTRPGRLTKAQRCAAALAWAGPGAALTSRTAAAIDGLKGYEDDRIHLMVSNDSGLRSRDFVVVYRTLWLDSLHVHPTRRPRRARVERAVIDIATSARSWQDAIAVTAAAVQQGLTRVADLEAILADYPRACWRRELLSMLVDLEGGSQSLPEVEAIRAIRAACLPIPDRQAIRMEGTRRRYLDLFWDLFQLCIEIDGRLHISVETWWADMLRDAEISIGGPSVIRIPAFVVREREDAFIDLVRRLLISRGWTPPTATLALQ